MLLIAGMGIFGLRYQYKTKSLYEKDVEDVENRKNFLKNIIPSFKF